MAESRSTAIAGWALIWPKPPGSEPGIALTARASVIVNLEAVHLVLAGRHLDLDVPGVEDFLFPEDPDVEEFWRVAGLVADLEYLEGAWGLSDDALLANQSNPMSPVHDLASEAVGDVERYAADRLDVSPLRVALAAHLVWGHSLVSEREKRVAAGAPVTGRRLQALRGNISRRLIRELAEFIQGKEDSRGLD